MAVVLANANLTLRRRQHTFSRDAHGMPVAPAVTYQTVGPLPGWQREQPDRTWRLRLQPECWPVEPGDEITDDAGRTFVVSEARLSAIPTCSDVDFVAVRATLNPPKVP